MTVRKALGEHPTCASRRRRPKNSLSVSAPTPRLKPNTNTVATTRRISQVRPETAVISVGRYNPYGHPAADVVAAYERTGARLFRTDRDGAVWFSATLSSPSMEIHTAREHLPEPVRVGPSMLGSERRNLGRIWHRWMGP